MVGELYWVLDRNVQFDKLHVLSKIANGGPIYGYRDRRLNQLRAMALALSSGAIFIARKIRVGELFAAYDRNSKFWIVSRGQK
jgi:hypothetical protein